MPDESILFSVDDRGIATIRLNRPDIHNAFNDSVIANLIDAIQACESNDNVRVVLLCSSGKNFSAGADLAWMKSMAQLDFNANKEDASELAKLMQQLHAHSKPVICKVQGKSFGGALGLIACCDIAIACSDATFCLSEVKIGLVPAVISPYVIQAMGQRIATRYFITGESFTADQALSFGLLHEISDSTHINSTVDRIVNSILNNGPIATSQAKKLVQQVGGKPIDDSIINHTTELIAKIRVSEEGQEGLDAFLNKRQPNWIHV